MKTLNETKIVYFETHLCDCGHTVKEDEIYNIADCNNQHLHSLCLSCWHLLPLVKNEYSRKLAEWRLPDSCIIYGSHLPLPVYLKQLLSIHKQNILDLYEADDATTAEQHFLSLPKDEQFTFVADLLFKEKSNKATAKEFFYNLLKK